MSSGLNGPARLAYRTSYVPIVTRNSSEDSSQLRMGSTVSRGLLRNSALTINTQIKPNTTIIGT